MWCWNETAGNESQTIFSFWSSEKRRKGFLKINDSVKYSLQRWKIYHPCVIQSPIENDYIKIKLDGGNGWVKNKLHKKFLLQVSVHELHIYMQKICYWFFMAYDRKGLVCISDSDRRLLLPPQSWKMTQHHQIVCCYKIWI